MARIGSVAVGGYYPAPPHVMQHAARLVRAPASADEFSVLDPCAGEGAAVLDLLSALFDEEVLRTSVDLYAVELEATRYAALEKAARDRILSYSRVKTLHGDAMACQWTDNGSRGVSLCWLNPPYDLDPQHGRLEERFLARFAPAIVEGGALLYFVPFYALAASARTLATHFRALHCYRLSDSDFATFKQVVLVATKRAPLLDPDPAIVAQVQAWAASVDGMPVLDDTVSTVATAPSHRRYEDPLYGWRIADLDVAAVAGALRPWSASDKAGAAHPIAGLTPDRPVIELLTRTYPIAMPPKPAHIAAGLAAGVFSGARVVPDDPTSPLPPLLTKAVFERDFVTVEEKHNKDGDKTGEVQVQQPRLSVTVLDTRAGTYHTLASSGDVTGATDVASMTAADLLDVYGGSLLDTMRAHCPTLHDPEDPAQEIQLAAMPRTLFHAQRHAVMTTVKLLGGPNAKPRERRGKSAFVLGEIGSGKSSVALATAATIGARRMLIVCPPHLLDGWRDQARACVPWAAVDVLASVSDVDAYAAATDPGLRIAVLSREAAKLGHPWAGVTGQCPRCGAPVTDGADVLARKRARCEATRLRPRNAAASVARALAVALGPVEPDAAEVVQLHSPREHRLLGRYARRTKKQRAAAWATVRTSAVLRDAAMQIAVRLIDATSATSALGDALVHLLGAMADYDLTDAVVRALYLFTSDDESEWQHGGKVRAFARMAIRDLPAAWRDPLVADLRTWPLDERGYSYGYNRGSVWDSRSDSGGEDESEELSPSERAVLALSKLMPACAWARTRPCGEPLYQAVPEPRRVPLATYIARRHPDMFDLLVLDEAHEYSTSGDSAQSLAGHRLSALGAPTLAMTGSAMNGYAASLFANQWALDPDFRREFERGDVTSFVKRYGYIKQVVENRDPDGKLVEFGSMSDRVQRKTRTVGNAPGVLPLFVLRYLLRRAVTLHKADLALDLPPCHEIPALVPLDGELQERATRLQYAIMQRIRADRFDAERAGKLFGQLAELPSYLDRATADTGNREDGSYVIAYPASVPNGGAIASEEPFPASTILPKERWILDTARRELAEGRRVMVFGWHEAVLPRLTRLLAAELGEPVAFLEADRVPSAKRQGWIDREVIAKGRRVLVVNGTAVQTGLNNLVWFQSAVWAENPGCNAIGYRQANGRLDRIGQTAEVRIYFPIYEGSIQEDLHHLLMHKVGVSCATDGLDGSAALAAAGVGEMGTFDAMSVGKALFERLSAPRKARAPVATTRAGAALPTTDPPDSPPVQAPPKPKGARGVQLSLF